MAELIPLLQVTNLFKQFVTKRWLKPSDVFTAVNNISFTLHKGEILGLLGPNGAGKTTTIQMLLGVMTPTSGTITYSDKELSKHRSEILKGISFATTYTKLTSRLTIWENLDIHGCLYDMPRAQRHEKIKEHLQLFGIWDIRDKESGSLSAGQTTRAVLAKAFMTDPKIVLLDEPTASLDPDIAHEVRKFVIKQQQERGVSVLFTSHNMDEVTEVCDRILVLKNGSIIADNTPEKLAMSVSLSRIHLTISVGLSKLIAYLQEQKHVYVLEKNSLVIEIDEKQIAAFLTHLAHNDIIYVSISVEQPTLEDYFLQITQK